MSGPPKAGRRLQLVDTRSVIKNRLDGKRYLVILRRALFKANLDKTLLEKDQIECFCVKVYSRPRAFGRKQLVEARYQVVRSVKLYVSWYGYTRYLDISPPQLWMMLRG